MGRTFASGAASQPDHPTPSGVLWLHVTFMMIVDHDAMGEDFPHRRTRSEGGSVDARLRINCCALLEAKQNLTANATPSVERAIATRGHPVPTGAAEPGA